MSESTQTTPFDGSEIAVIGLAGRFPGARTIDAFWQNVRDGVESITVFSDDQLIAAGVNPALFARPDYVRAGVVLEDADKFDAFFFGFSPREAEILDPQHRLFLECAWEALETAGYDPGSTDASIGVFAGTGRNTYYEHNLRGNAEVMKDGGGFEASLGNESDFLTTRVAYKLNLKGPSLSIQTSCSTSLVAVHVACQHLVLHQCDLALAGGVFLGRLPAAGYLHQPGGIVSSDGHCRAFDAKADGAVSGRGAGVVVLKRLRDALRDGDTIRAVVRGSAVNNDGSNKVSYSAPSVAGQSEVIAEAIAVAGVPAESIGLVEAHGTGTPLGDPAEIAALTKVYRAETDRRSFCAIGSLKTNLGHMDVAAGIAGLMKAVLALEHGQLPPSLHFTKPNPEIDFADSPFFVNTTLRPWVGNGHPRRAAVSSFGIGGTNAHVILEEAPKAETRPASGHPQALILSARTREALETATDNLAGYLQDHPDADLGDVAFTLQTGRRPFEHRRAIVCGNVAEAIEALRSRDGSRVVTTVVNGTRPSVVFIRPAGVEDAAAVRTFAELLEDAGIHPAAVIDAEAGEIALTRYPGHIAVPMMSGDSWKPILDVIVRLWTSGADVIWPALHGGQNRRRIPLPTYPFARHRFWIEPQSIEATRARQRRGKIADLAQWFHRPVWKQAHPLAPSRTVDRTFIVISNGCVLGKAVRAALRDDSVQVIDVRAGDRLRRFDDDRFELSIESASDFEGLLREIGERTSHPIDIVHLAGVTTDAPSPDDALSSGFYSVLALAQGIDRTALSRNVHVTVVTSGAQSVTGDERLMLAKAAVLGPCRVIPQEMTHVGCSHVDIAGATLSDAQLAALTNEIREHRDRVVALRGAHRWVQSFEPLRPAPSQSPVLREGGVYLITGGTGGIGLTLAEHLAESVHARLVLLSRTPMPARSEWVRLAAERPAGDVVVERIHRIEAIERLGGEVLVIAADVTREAEMAAAVRAARERFGTIHGVIHAAGVAGGGLAALKTREAAAGVLGPKVHGLFALHNALAGEPLDFLMLCSSLHGLVGGLGQIDYAAANAVLDLYAQDRWSRGDTFVMSVNWDAWREVGMAVNTPVPEDIRQRRDESLRHAITPREGRAVFDAVVGCRLPQVVVYAQDFDALLAAAIAVPGHDGIVAEAEPARPRHPRPPLAVAFVAPRTALERSVCEAFEKVLGLEQVGIHDSFFDLGGHSLLAVRVMARVNEALGIDLPVAKLYEGLTVSFLVEQVAPAAGEDEHESAERRRDKAKRQREHQQRRRVALGR